MFDKYFRKDISWGGQLLTLETGKIARQADGAVMARLGDTIVLCTVVGARSVKPGQDFFPLTVNYQEKAFAAGKIPGGFFKREGRPSENETLVSRLIDRPLRPLFPDGFRNEVQVVATVLSHDLENNPDIVALVGCSAALTLSGIPFFGPVAGARVAWIDGGYVLNPTAAQLAQSDLDLVVAGTAEGVLMVESEAKELSEDIMLGAVEFGHKSFQPVIQGIIELAEVAAKDAWALPEESEATKALKARIAELGRAPIAEAYKIVEKLSRQNAVGAAKKAVLAQLEAEGLDAGAAKGLLKELEADVVRNAILDTGLRIDGRDTKTVRPIVAEVGILPRSHGSALFTRGETQALCVATLGTGQDEQIIDALAGEYRENFMLHYNFPPYSVNETGRMGSPGRREIGHGKLAWRAIHPLLPEKEKFPYTLRVVSEMVAQASRPSVGAVGGRLACPQGRLLHAGYALDPEAVVIPALPVEGSGSDGAGPCGLLALPRQVSAVSGDGLMVRRSVFQALGGFDAAALPEALYDVDLCLRLREAGLMVLHTPFATLRVRDRPPPAGSLALAREAMRFLWGAALAGEGFTNPNLLAMARLRDGTAGVAS